MPISGLKQIGLNVSLKSGIIKLNIVVLLEMPITFSSRTLPKDVYNPSSAYVLAGFQFWFYHPVYISITKLRTRS